MLNNIAFDYNPYFSGLITYASVNDFVSKSDNHYYQPITTIFYLSFFTGLLNYPDKTLNYISRRKYIRNNLLYLCRIHSVGK